MVTRTPRAAERWLRTIGALCLWLLQLGCAKTLPPNTAEVTRVRIAGADAISPRSIQQCIATRPRERFGFMLGDTLTGCGTPPFQSKRFVVSLWTWPWTARSPYDPAVLERDLERVTRFYRARGFYQAQVNDAEVEKPDERSVAITIKVQEGEPVLVRDVQVTGTDDLASEVQQALHEALSLRSGDRFDEYFYDESKAALQRILGNAGHAHAQVHGQVQLHSEEHWADIWFQVAPGPACHFGHVYVEGHKDLPVTAVRGAARISAGDRYSLSALTDARRAIYALGPFASVDVEPLLDPDSDQVDVRIKLVPGRRTRLAFGIGMEVGGNLVQGQGVQTTGDSFAQWDMHLVGRFEHRNFLGGMRRLRIEERPRLIFDDPFPRTGRPNPGNTLSVDFRQPAFFEARTALLATLRWELGPDPYGGSFYRSQLTATVGPERHFLGGILRLATTLNGHHFQEIAAIEDGPYPNYDVVYFNHTARLELRDDARRPTRGAYFSASLIHAGYLLPGDFDYIRITPEARGYLPLPLGIILAGRLGLGWMEVTHTELAAPTADGDPYGFLDRLRRFGPLQHRLRGGGHNSVRGYRPNTLGDAVLVDGRLDSGGTRQWLASLELRVPLTSSFSTVLFADAGDVSQARRFRWDHPQTTVGLGLRYHTLVGPIRLDLGFAPPALQTLGSDQRLRDGLSQSSILGLAPGAIQFTVGEAF